jgi:hypothetical protein
VCDCGEKIIRYTRSLLCGESSTCDNCRVRGGDKCLIGRTFGRWKVVDFAPSDDRNNVCWTVECECGYSGVRNTTRLLTGKSTQCEACGHRRPWKQSGWEYIWVRVLGNAKMRGIEVLVSEEEARSLLESQRFLCALSGFPLVVAESGIEATRKLNTTASLDRIDSAKPYEHGNIQWIHKEINRMKNKYSQQRFIEVCRGVARTHPEIHLHENREAS